MKGRSRSSSTPTKRSNSTRSSKSVGKWTKAAALRELKNLADPKVRAKLAYFGVNVPKACGISAPVLHAFARHIGKDQSLAQELWSTGIHEARILAALIGESEKVTAAQMERWVHDFNSWDVVDTACCYLYASAKPAWDKIYEWSGRRAEFEKRAAFSLAAYLSYKDKTADDVRFERFLSVIEREAHDERNFVRKAVNWALRNIGKRSLRLNVAAIRSAERIRQQDSRTARWIAADALRELRSEAIQARLRKKAGGEMAKRTENKGVKIRRAGSSDAPQLAELSGQLGYPTTAAEIQKRLRNLKPASKNALFVAESPGGGIVGWAHVSVTHLVEVGTRAELNGLIVADGQRSLGAGARLLEAAEDWARKRGCPSISVRSNVIRERAHTFYERQGYEHYKTQKAFRKTL
jgi:3-methyladenine DNA glycosylase AlkD/GNAT superfamily N-acetyltransferase